MLIKVFSKNSFCFPLRNSYLFRQFHMRKNGYWSGIGFGSASSSSSAPIYYWTSNPSMAGITYTAGRLNTVTSPPAWNGDASRVPPNSKHILFDHKIAGQAITLNNGNEGIAVNNNSTTVVGTNKQLSVTVYWTEESST